MRCAAVVTLIAAGCSGHAPAPAARAAVAPTAARVAVAPTAARAAIASTVAQVAKSANNLEFGRLVLFGVLMLQFHCLVHPSQTLARAISPLEVTYQFQGSAMDRRTTDGLKIR